MHTQISLKFKYVLIYLLTIHGQVARYNLNILEKLYLKSKEFLIVNRELILFVYAGF